MPQLFRLTHTKVRKKGKKNQKHGRNKKKCEKYRLLKKRERSHLRRLQKHQKLYKDFSPMVLVALKKYQALLNE